jgi:DNA-binding transcriptional regulator LsrR (DeoR family)
MYHEGRLKQPQIAERLHLSQPTVSRLLKQAQSVGIVQTTVVEPRGVHASLEDDIERRFGLTEVVIADSEHLQDDADVLPRIATVAARYLETTLDADDEIGISSWSATLLATSEAMHQRPGLRARKVVQILGGHGSLMTQTQATRLLGRLAQTTRAQPIYLVAPGLLGSAAMKDALLAEPNIADVMRTWQHLDVVVVGIGSLEPSDLLRQSGNAVDPEEQVALRRQGAVGDICLRFFDADGNHIRSTLDDRVLGIPVRQLRQVPRRIAIAGGTRKWGAIAACVKSGWVNVLITDVATARHLKERVDA